MSTEPSGGSETKLSPELEEAIREAARKCCPDCAEGSRPSDGLHGYTSDGFPMVCRQPARSILRSLVRRAQRETAERCAEIAKPYSNWGVDRAILEAFGLAPAGGEEGG